MHLCEPCRSSRDWEGDPVVQAKIARNLQQADENRKARCATCRTYIRNPLFRLCAKCAQRDELCQYCSKSTITPEARAAIETAAAKRDELIDLYTFAVKAYGLTATRRLFGEMRAEFGEHVEMLLLLDFRDLDYGRERRPIWTKVLGTNVYRLRWCDDCHGVLAPPPAVMKAAYCEHFTIATSPAYCPVCAADKDACERCGIASD